jgi:hypothetical protein
MKKEETKPNKVKFFYEKTEDYRPVYINGAYGGMSPKGELIAHFYMEYSDVPLEQITPLDDKGRLIKEETLNFNRRETPKDTMPIKREIKTGIIIPAQEVRNIASWMIDHLEKSGIEIKEEDDNE